MNINDTELLNNYCALSGRTMMEGHKHLFDLNDIRRVRLQWLRTPVLRFAFTDHLRSIVERRIKEPAELDLIDAYPFEHIEALLRTFGRWPGK